MLGSNIWRLYTSAAKFLKIINKHHTFLILKLLRLKKSIHGSYVFHYLDQNSNCEYGSNFNLLRIIWSPNILSISQWTSIKWNQWYSNKLFHLPIRLWSFLLVKFHFWKYFLHWYSWLIIDDLYKFECSQNTRLYIILVTLNKYLIV